LCGIKKVKYFEKEKRKYIKKKRGCRYQPQLPWAETELNRRHMDFQSIALPTELSAQKLASKNKHKLNFLKGFILQLRSLPGFLVGQHPGSF
jgi:hypothetical protein